jgi:hypothetical protein
VWLFPSIYLSFYPSTCPPTHLSICLSFYLCDNQFPICLVRWAFPEEQGVWASRRHLRPFCDYVQDAQRSVFRKCSELHFAVTRYSREIKADGWTGLRLGYRPTGKGKQGRTWKRQRDSLMTMIIAWLATGAKHSSTTTHIFYMTTSRIETDRIRRTVYYLSN